MKIEPFRQHDTDDAFGFFERIDEVVDTTQAEAADRMYADPEQEAIATLEVATLSGQTMHGARRSASPLLPQTRVKRHSGDAAFWINVCGPSPCVHALDHAVAAPPHDSQPSGRSLRCGWLPAGSV